MAQIREELTLVDKFSAQFTKFISMAERAARGTRIAQVETQRLEAAQVTAGQASQDASLRMRDYQSAADRVSRRLAFLNSQFEAYSQEQEKLVRANAQGSAAFQSLENTLNKIGGQIRIGEAQLETLNRQMSSLEARSNQASAGYNRLNGAIRQGKKAADAASSSLRKVVENALGINKAQPAYEGFLKQLRRVSLTLFSIEKIINAVRDSMERAPDSISKSFEQAGKNIQDVFAGSVVSAMNAMQPSIDRFNEFLNSAQGTKLIGILSQGFQILGQVAGFAIDLLVSGAQWVADNWDLILPILVAVGAYMVASAVAGMIAWAGAALPFILIVAAIALVIFWLQKMGVSFEQMGAYIGGVIMALVAGIVNIVVGLINGIIQFIWTYFVEPFLGIIEWVLNVANGGFNSFGDAVASLIGNIISWFLSLGKVVTKIIDAIFGTDWTAGLSSLQNEVLSWGKNENAITLDRNAPTIDYRMDYTDAWNKGFEVGGNIGAGLDNFQLGTGGMFDSLSGIQSSLQDISADTSSIKKAVSLSEEDLSMLADMAERQYVNKINLTSQSPVITVQGANTGNTDLDRRNIADAIKRILLEQAASATVNSYARV